MTAAKRLFWLQGFESTSPNDIYRESGAGQGSFYHHFKGKLDLAHQVLLEICEDEIAVIDRVMDENDDPLKRIEAYLSLPREGTRGCKLGRFVYEPSIEKPEIREPVAHYLAYLRNFLESTLTQAQTRGQLGTSLSPDELAQIILTTIQGGYVLSRAFGESRQLNDATAAVKTLLKLLCKN